MKKTVLFALLTLGFAIPAGAAFTPYPIQLPEDFVHEVKNIFPEGILAKPELLDYDVDPNIHLFQDAEVLITFIDEGASLLNNFGYFLFKDLNQDGQIQEEEIQKRQPIFENSSKEGSGGALKPGDTVNLGRFPKGSHMGFYLEGDGFRETLWTFYTIDQLNFDGQRHLAMMATQDNEHVALGIEDLPWNRSDKDFNDILFTFSTNPKSALTEVIEAGNIPRQSELTDQKVEEVPLPNQVAEPPAVAAPPAIEPLLLQGGGMMCRIGDATGPAAAPPWILLALFYLAALWFCRVDMVATCSYHVNKWK